MVQVFFIFLIGLCIAKENEIKRLKCYTTKTPSYFPFPQYELEGSHSEMIEYTEKDELRTGPPVCVTFFGSNETHSVAWQGHVSTFSLPLDCHLHRESYTNCVNSTNDFVFLSIKKGFVCCCGWDGCNYMNPSFFQHFEEQFVDLKGMKLLRAFCRYAFCAVFCVFIVIVSTIFEVSFERFYEKSKRKSQELMKEKMEERSRKVKEIQGISPMDVQATPLLPDSLKVEGTQPTPKSSQKPPLSEMTLRPDPSLKEDVTQNEDLDELMTGREIEKLDLADTQKGEDISDDIVPIPPKPECGKTSTGRIKRVSMNHDESTFSDLE